ncbi:MAG: inositol monophosphatase family protein, partial [Candidatus Dormibacteria bacterium]
MVRAADDPHVVAARLAQAAGRFLLDLRRDLVDQDVSGRALGDRGDRGSHELLFDGLRRAFPDDAILSEEGVDDLSRLDSDRVWIIDPLDGTREFGEPPRVDWAVHVALVVEGHPDAGAVALPAQGLLLTTQPPIQVGERRGGPLRLAVSRTRPPALAAALGANLGAELISMGSAGAKTVAVIRGDVDVYVHAGGQGEWDSAAPVAVARAAGLH